MVHLVNIAWGRAVDGKRCRRWRHLELQILADSQWVSTPDVVCWIVADPPEGAPATSICMAERHRSGLDVQNDVRPCLCDDYPCRVSGIVPLHYGAHDVLGSNQLQCRNLLKERVAVADINWNIATLVPAVHHDWPIRPQIKTR